MIKIRNFILVFICCFISILLFLSTSVQAYNLRYIANVSSDGSGGQSLTFRKYVRHYGPTYTTGWSYPGTLLSKNGGGNINGSYGTRAMVFHKSPGTTYYDSGDPDGNGNGALRVGYDFSGSEDYIDTDGELRGADNYVNKDHDILYNFANLYNIRTSHIWIKLGQGSKNDVGWGEYYKTGDLIVSKERILRESAITDFKAEGATYNNIINAIKSNEEKRGNYYETYVSGELQVKKFEDGRVYNGVASSQELIDIMMPESFQAYNNWTSSNKKINSQWSPKDFGYGSMYFSDQNVANGDSNGDIDNSRKETTQGFNTGYSVLNNFDNILKVPCEPDNSKVICVNHFDIATGNRIYSAENTSQELLDSSGNSKGQKANGLEGYDNEGGNWQELYRIQEGEWLKVRSSQKIKNGELKDSSGKQYKYYGYWKNSFDRDGNTWKQNVEKSYNNISDGTKKEDGYTVDDNELAITTIDFYYTPNSTNKKREIFVNHLTEDGKKLTELAGTSQTILPENMTTANLANNPTYKSQAQGYLEYYTFYSNWKMKVRNYKGTTKGTVFTAPNGKKYKYLYYKTCSGSTMDNALDRSKSAVTKSDNPEYEITHTNPVTIVSFYYEEYNPGGGGGGDDDDDEFKVNILGKLQFTSDYRNTANNSEFVPVSAYLYPYIDGAQKYILPNIKEDVSTSTVKGDVYNKTSTGKSYWDDYEEYRSVKIVGTNKTGDYSGSYSKVYEYNKNYTAGSTTVSSSTGQEQPLKVYNGTRKNTLTIAGQTITLADYATTEGKDQTITINGQESGYVKYTTTYSETGSETTGEAPNQKTTYYYTYSTSHEDPLTGNTVTSEEKSGSGSKVPDDKVVYKSETVKVTYEVTLRKKWKLSHLYIYRIKDKSPTVAVNNGATNNDNRGKVYDKGDTGIKIELTTSYMDSIKNRLKTYYQDYNDTRRKIPSAIQNSKLVTGESDFKQSDSGQKSYYLVGSNKYNGIRSATATIEYEGFDLAEDKNYSSLTKLNHSYSDIEENERINIFTPLHVTTSNIESGIDIVNQTGDSRYNRSIQRNVQFTFTPRVASYTYGSKTIDTKTYLSEYYVKFDFNIYDIQIGGGGNYFYLDSGTRKSLSNNGGKSFRNYNNESVRGIPAGTYIVIPKGGYIKATAKDPDVGQFNNQIRIFASTINEISPSFVDKNVYGTGEYFGSILNDRYYMDSGQITQRGTSRTVNKTTTYNGTESVMYLDSRYITYINDSTANLGRIYDFRVTDCTDLGFKNVFRNSGSSSDVNKTNNQNYFYSGKYMWSVRTMNSLIKRTTPNIIPVGPFKNNVDKTYTFAPKLGYRFSFDVKTTGFMNNDTKFVRVTPTYYYISKKGDGYLGDSEITLYYKNSSGKYVPFKTSGFNIQFKPNDGYRALEFVGENDENYDTLSDLYQNLKIGATSFNLLNSTMITKDFEGYIQCWYGEFKLPNSTIALKNSDKTQLTNGYIGVKFNLEAVEKYGGSERVLSYNAVDKGSGGGKANTTQWDYEGYLGYSYDKYKGDFTSSAVDNVALHQGIWKINNQADYNRVKGTVMLYDIDSRAANDFN